MKTSATSITRCPVGCTDKNQHQKLESSAKGTEGTLPAKDSRGLIRKTDGGHRAMGKKRKAIGRPAAEMQNVQTKYDVDEQFADSEDEFFAGRDKILLDEGPAGKRRRKLEEQGKRMRILWICLVVKVLTISFRTVSTALRRRSPWLRRR